MRKLREGGSLPYIPAPVFWLRAWHSPLLVESGVRSPWQSKATQALVRCTTASCACACWGQESSFQTRRITLALEGSQNTVVPTLNLLQWLQSHVVLQLSCACFCSCDVPAPKCLRNFKASGNVHPMFRKFSIPQTPISVSHLSSGASTSCVFQHSSDHGAFLLHPALLLISRLYFKCFAADPRRNKPKSQLPQKQSPESMTR